MCDCSTCNVACGWLLLVMFSCTVLADIVLFCRACRCAAWSAVCKNRDELLYMYAKKTSITHRFLYIVQHSKRVLYRRKISSIAEAQNQLIAPFDHACNACLLLAGVDGASNTGIHSNKDTSCRTPRHSLHQVSSM